MLNFRARQSNVGKLLNFLTEKNWLIHLMSQSIVSYLEADFRNVSSGNHLSRSKLKAKAFMQSKIMIKFFSCRAPPQKGVRHKLIIYNQNYKAINSL